MSEADTVAIITALIGLCGAIAVVLRLVVQIIGQLRGITAQIVQLSEHVLSRSSDHNP
jgi:hypothetical protein